MTGRELIEKLNQLAGERLHFVMNDVLFYGTLSIYDGDNISVTYDVGNTRFIILDFKNYTFNTKEFYGTTNIYIDEVK
jgi:hypothetical protein